MNCSSICLSPSSMHVSVICNCLNYYYRPRQAHRIWKTRGGGLCLSHLSFLQPRKICLPIPCCSSIPRLALPFFSVLYLELSSIASHSYLCTFLPLHVRSRSATHMHHIISVVFSYHVYPHFIRCIRCLFYIIHSHYSTLSFQPFALPTYFFTSIPPTYHH